MAPRIDITREHRTGFCLDEPRLRSVVEVMGKRLGQKANAVGADFEVRLEGDTVYHVQSVDDVVALDNRAPNRITHINLSMFVGKYPDEHTIDVTFRSVRRGWEIPVKYAIKSSDQDWAANAERDVSSRVYGTLRELSYGRTRVGLVVAYLILLGLALGPRVRLKTPPDRLAELRALLADWEAHRVTDPLAVQLKLAIMAEEYRSPPPGGLLAALIVVVVLGVLLVATDVPKRLHDWIVPPYSFAWGQEAVDLARRSQRVQVLVVGFLFCGVIAGVVGGWIQRLLGI